MDFKDLISMDEIRAPGDNMFVKSSLGDIAIIGMSARLPDVDGIGEFWDKIALGTDFVGTIPEQRKKDAEDYLSFMGHLKDKEQLEEGAYIKSIDKFDYGFFNLSPNEAALMDPNQRLFLETAWETIEDAGYSSNEIMGSNTAVFVGFSNEAEYKKIIYDVANPSLRSMSVQGNLSPVIASRISYLLDLRGPSLLVNTACSSSLVALHLGCQALKNGECSMALIGGIQIHLIPIRQVEIGIESSSKRTRTFDHQSDGTGGGEGVIAVLLKPLYKALKDEDNIYAVIKGSAYNQDGASAGISAPNPVAQEDVIVKAWQEAGINPETISYIEAHGTGTKLGDPIEIDGIQRAFRRFTNKRQFCAIGSVKSNIGHLDGAAGLAGLLKAVLSLQKGQIPPTINFKRPNRMIAFHKSPIYVNTKLREWKTYGFPRRCGVSSFGFSGTNCHVILEEAPQVNARKDKKEGGIRILTLSAKTIGSLEKLVALYSELNYDELGHKNVCYTSNKGRNHYNYRLAIPVESGQDLREKLEFLKHNDLKNSGQKEIFYNKFNVIDENKDINEHGDITKEEKEALEKQAQRLLETLRTIDDIKSEMVIKICELYVKGANIQWDDLYQFDIRKKVRLPVYPFDSRRCWINIPKCNEDNPEEFLFVKNWCGKAIDESICRRVYGVVLVVEDGVIGLELAKALAETGNKVVEARISDEYKKVNSDLYFISSRESDFKGLIDEIGVENITQIIYCVLPTSMDGNPLSNLEAKLNKVLYGFFHLIKNIMVENLINVDIVLLGRCVGKVDGSEKEIIPEYGALFGLGRVVNIEDFRIKCRCMDFDHNTPISSLLNEIKLGYQDSNVAYRKGKRYIQEIMGINPCKLKNREIQIKEGGIYVITGGMGGIGLSIASYFSSKSKVKIILINRTKYPEREKWDAIVKQEKNSDLANRLNMVLDIEKNGSLVEVCTADVAKREEIGTVLNSIRRKHGKINGVIHSAAIGVGSKGRSIENESLDRFIHVISPKIQGTCLLEEETKGDELDFFVVFSSPITLMGAIGSGSYTAANTYLESFTEARNINKKHTICMSWAPWEKTVKASKEDFTGNKQMFLVLSTEELIRSFELIMDKEINQSIVGRLNYNSDLFHLKDILPFYLSDDLKSKVKAFEPNKSVNGSFSLDAMLSDVILKGSGDDAYTDNEKLIAKVWGNILGYAQLSLYDNFYELGGDSIIAMKTVNRINDERDLELNVRDLLSNLTIKKMAAFLDKKQNLNKKYSYIPLVESKDYYPVSMSQKRILLLSSKRENDISWNMSWAFSVKGDLDKNKLEEAFRFLVERHEILKTSFGVIKGEPVQIVGDSVEFQFEYGDLNSKTIDEAVKEFIKPFDLEKAPLLRAGLFKMDEKEHLLLLDVHHIIADATSAQILLHEIESLYNGVKLPELPIQFKDYAEWQNNLFYLGVLDRQKEYWNNKFKGEIPLLNLANDYPRNEMEEPRGDIIYAEIDEDLTSKLKRLASRTGASIFMVLVSIYFIVIWKFSSQSEISIGVPISGRTHAQLEKLIGMFVNIIVLKQSINSEKSFMDLLMDVKEDFLESCENSEYPFYELVNDLGIITENNRNPLFDVSFVMQNTGAQTIEMGDSLKFISHEHDNGVSRNDILIEAIEVDHKIRLIVEYNLNLFNMKTVQNIINGYLKIANIVCENNTIKLKDITVLTEVEKALLIHDFNENLDVKF